MFLALDIGNSNIKAGVFKNQEIVHHFTESNFHALLSSIKHLPLTCIAISSVVPDKTNNIIGELKNTFNIQPFVIKHDSKLNLKLGYKTPHTLGIDRICSAEGAYLMCNKYLAKGTYLITSDFGTATTVNIVKYPNVFTGGIIAPGINTMFDSLNKNTAQLPELTIEIYSDIIGDSTDSSIASGVVNSTVGLIEKVISYIFELTDCEEIIFYATGGMTNKK